MNPKEKTLWHDGLQYDLLLGIALELIVLFVSIFFWHMQFPKLAVAKAAVLNLLYLVLALPLLVGIFGLSARSMETHSGHDSSRGSRGHHSSPAPSPPSSSA